MAWLLCDGKAVASVEVAEGFVPRLRGLLGRDHVEGAFLLPRTSSVHTIGMRLPIEVAYCDRNFEVLSVRAMQPQRIGLPRPHSRYVVEASLGAFERWGLRVGSRLELRP